MANEERGTPRDVTTAVNIVKDEGGADAIARFNKAVLAVARANRAPMVLQSLVQGAVELSGAARAQYWVQRDQAVVAAGDSVTELIHDYVARGAVQTAASWHADDPTEPSPHFAAIEVPAAIRGGGVGVLRLYAAEERPFTPDTLQLLQMLVDQTAVALDNVQRFAQLERAKREWTQIFDGMVEGVYVCRADGLILRANIAAAKMLGMRPHDMVNKRREELHAGLTDYEVIKPWHGVEHEPSQLELQATEFRFGMPERVFNETSFVLPVFDNTPGGFDEAVHKVYILRDITMQSRLQAQLLQSEKLAALGELVTGVAHELNNPLTTVVGYAQLLQGDASVPARVDRQIAKIHQEAVRASHIVQNLLAFARRSQPHKTWIDLNHELQNVINMREYQLQADHVEVKTDFAPDLPEVWGDPNQLQQVFLNVINNAAQAMVEWKGKGEIQITTRRTMVKSDENSGSAPGVLIAFSDNGPGMTPEQKSKVFDPFFTTKRVGEGTGLGMSISHGILKNHNGNIRTESILGHGAQFFVELPAVADEAELVPMAFAEVAPNLAQQGRILVVDDEELVVTLITEILALDGHCVTPAFNGAEALDLLETHDFDLIISDVRMPAVAGPTFFEILQTTRPDLLTRVIFVTGDTVSPSTQHFLQKTGRPMLAKPFNPERLRALVNETLTANAAPVA